MCVHAIPHDIGRLCSRILIWTYTTNTIAVSNDCQFIVRGQVLSLYRSYLRQLRPLADPATKRDMRSWIRGEFERTRWESDIEKIKSHLSEGRAQLKRVAALVGLGTA
ncbi:hypothetical protein BCR44DRAFT_123331 [Catenaria anguillulae PL171]|uniref:LYR motif-containing protein 2 n=1 Tax=Catenaria anguillulae PL171 TaxID=765915 RepID=A0A1Y2HBA7_9FUNG|nr:hypothetical protein BCR44DRAFT_123331 [Catenaria anguillulae PL171]